ncbi:hypothetical protein JCM10207_007135 [Rhodosporidiobolus poonsookiae]
MLVFVTGATGFVGRSVVSNLLSHGHRVLALARSDKSAASFAGKEGVEIHQGSLDELDRLVDGAKKADGVIHLAYKHDFENYLANAELDVKITKAFVSALSGTSKPLVITSACAGFARDSTRDPSQPATEDHVFPPGLLGAPRIASEQALAPLAAQGGRAAVIRLPFSVHGPGDGAFVSALAGVARDKGVAAYIGDGSNHWPAVHVDDAAELYRLALEKAPEGKVSVFHASNEEDGLALKDMAAIMGKRLDVPVKSIAQDEAGAHFGWLAMFTGLNVRVASKKTREELGWKPVRSTLREDLEAGLYC